MIALFAVVGPAAGYGLSRILPPVYRSQTVVLVEPPNVSSNIVQPVVMEDISQRLASMQAQILSRANLEAVIHQFGLFPQDLNRVSMDTLVARLQKAITVSPVQPMEDTQSTSLPGFTLDVRLASPQAAQQVCSAITSMFIAQNLQTAQQRSQSTSNFLSEQLADAKRNLDEQDAKFAAFQSKYMGALPDNEQANLNILTGLTSQLDASNQALVRAQQDKSFTESLLAQQLSAWGASQGGQNPVESLERQLADLQAKLQNLEARYTDDYPDVIKAKHDIDFLEVKIAEADAHKGAGGAAKARTAAEPAQVLQLRNQIHADNEVISEKAKEQRSIRAQIKKYQALVQSSPAIEEQYKELTRGYQTALDSYNDLLKKRDDAAMATDLQRQQLGEQFRVLDPANLPTAPSFPNPFFFTLGGLAGGLGLGVGLAIVLEMQDMSMRTEKDVESYLQLPVLAQIPTVEPWSTRRGKQPNRRLSAPTVLSLGERG